MQIKEESFGRFLEDFTVGLVIKHAVRKTVLESDNNLFCLLTMNYHPVHIDNEYANRNIHKKILVVGTYILSLVVGITVKEISGKAIANLEYENIRHEGPVFIGDTINAETEIIDIKVSINKPDRGVVYVETRAFNQRNEKILTFRRKVLIPKKQIITN
jgi:acyl dehydratase